MQGSRELARVMRLAQTAGLSLPEQRILGFFLEKKSNGVREVFTAYDVAEKKSLRIHKEKVYTHLKKLLQLNLLEFAGSGRPSKYRLKGSVTDVIGRLELLSLELMNSEIERIEIQKDDLRLLSEQAKKELSVGLREIEMDFYGVNMGADIHDRYFVFLEKLKPDEEVLAITPSALIWSVPEKELVEQPSVRKFRDLLAKRLIEGKFHARYVCFLDWFLTKSPGHRLDRLNTLLENVKKFKSLELIDASSHKHYISASPTLTIFGSEAVIVGLKGRSGKLEKGVVFTGKDVVNFFRDLFWTIYDLVKTENLETSKRNEGEIAYQDENARLKGYTVSRIKKLLESG